MVALLRFEVIGPGIYLWSLTNPRFFDRVEIVLKFKEVLDDGKERNFRNYYS